MSSTSLHTPPHRGATKPVQFTVTTAANTPKPQCHVEPAFFQPRHRGDQTRLTLPSTCCKTFHRNRWQSRQSSMIWGWFSGDRDPKKLPGEWGSSNRMALASSSVSLEISNSRGCRLLSTIPKFFVFWLTHADSCHQCDRHGFR